MLNLSSENKSPKYYFDPKPQAKFDKSDQRFEHQEEKLMGFKEKSIANWNRLDKLVPLKSETLCL